MSKSQLGLRIPTSLFNELNRYVEETGSSKTEVVCSAIAEYLGCAENIPLSQRMAEFERRLAALEAKTKIETN
ncbi:MAG: DNA-binding domain-containing protein [Crocosphaera sp.]